jgi:hypothetical protein
VKCYKQVSTVGAARWFWSSQLLFVVHTLVVFLFVEGHRRRLESLWRFVLLGFLCAISVASPLFVAKLANNDNVVQQLNRQRRTPLLTGRMMLLLVVGLASTFVTPLLVDARHFKLNLVLLHVVLMAPFLPDWLVGSSERRDVDDASDEARRRRARLIAIYALIALGSLIGHAAAIYRVLNEFEFQFSTILSSIFLVCCIVLFEYTLIHVLLRFFSFFVCST